MSSITDLISVGVNGTGTANYLMKWLDADTATDSVIYESSGNIGIGTSSPVGDGTALNLYGSTASTLKLQTASSGTGIADGGEIVMYDSDLIIKNREAGYIQLATSGTERMRIGSNGNVSIGGGTLGDALRIYNAGYPLVKFIDGSTDRGLLGYVFDWGNFSLQSESNLAFRTGASGGTERMRITSGGSIGIGTTSPIQDMHLYRNSTFSIMLVENANASGYALYQAKTAATGTWQWGAWTDDSFRISRAGIADHVTVSSAGDVSIGTTTDFGGKVSIAGDNVSIVTRGATSTNSGTWTMQRADTGASTWRITTNQDNFFVADADFSHYAFLVQNPTGWSFGSDERLKQDIEDIDYGLDTILNLKPRRFTFKSSQKNTVGFIAQELKGIVPEAVTGEEKEISDTDTNEEIAKKILGVSNDTLIPILVKAIQELKAEIETLKSQING